MMTDKNVDRALAHHFVINDTLHQLFDAVNVVSVQGYDEERRVIYWNEGSELIYGYSKEEASGKKLEDLIIPAPMREFVVAAHGNWIRDGIEIPAAELTLCHKNGNDVNVFSSHVLFTNAYNNKQMYCIDVNLADVKNAQSETIFKEKMLKTIINAIPDLFFLMEIDGSIIDYHGADQENIGFSPEDIISKNILEIFPDEVVNQFQIHIETILQQKKMLTFEYEQKVADGMAYFEARISYLPEYQQIVLIIRDITKQHESAKIIKHQAYFDSLTSLPNRFLALDRLSRMITECARSDEKTAVLFLDLDDFKKVNDTLGHEVGDKILIESANRLTDSLREADTVGRLGGDEFIVIIRGIKKHDDALVVADNLLNSFREPLLIGGRELILTLSIGVAIYPDNGCCASDLLRNADTAMYQAKAQGRNTCSFFSKEMNDRMIRQFEIEEQMHGALQRNEFEVYYQPQFDVKEQKIMSAEALLRWHNPKLGNITPDEFIPIAEQTGLIVPIGRFVLNQALIVLNQWQKIHKQDYKMGVNLSPRQFRDRGLFNDIKESLYNNKVNASALELEITEGVLMIGHSHIHETLMKMNKHGIKLSMDDFGTGYSSLSYLRQYAFDVLKIDRSFINGIPENKADCELVHTIIAMAHSLGLTVVAEGVETKEQLNLLIEFGCDVIQGYYFSKPIAATQFLNFSVA